MSLLLLLIYMLLLVRPPFDTVPTSPPQKKNKFSWKDGIEDVPVGVVTVPLSAIANTSSDARDSVRRPRWRDVESYDGREGGLEQLGSPQILVGVSIQVCRWVGGWLSGYLQTLCTIYTVQPDIHVRMFGALCMCFLVLY